MSELFPYVTEKQISFVPFYPLASGLLTGKYTSLAEVSEKNRKRPQFQESAFEQNLEKIAQVRRIATAKDAEVAQVILAWYLSRPCMM
ncbi:aldo/keto reductase [Neobacillus drentensis]|uniref:aldo/keto reductase n=1 Tax=Neobacillus drentensis TaxID=220684 RepID=UPI002FFF659A